jgi:hypothetical protein
MTGEQRAAPPASLIRQQLDRRSGGAVAWRRRAGEHEVKSSQAAASFNRIQGSGWNRR